MGGVSVETRELAYSVWRENSQNITETVRVMNSRHNYRISRQSVTAWCEKYGWEKRAARAEAEERKMVEGVSDSSLILALLAQKERYEAYFRTLGEGQVDNNATWAYNGILKQLLDTKKKRVPGSPAQPSDETRQEKGLSDETVEEIKKKILGLT